MKRQRTRQMTMSRALVENLAAQRIDLEDGTDERLCAGVFAIFGHGNVTCLGEALHSARNRLPTYRGQNEQAMGLACVGYARARLRRGFMAATSSIGPGATNMVTAAAVAHANRLPVLFMSGDTFSHRLADPVLQQVEHAGDPSHTANDAFKPVVQYWDRIVNPAQLISTLPQMYASMLNPASCGPAFLALPQDVQEVKYPYPVSFFEPVVHRVPRPRPDLRSLHAAAAVLAKAKRPLVVVGGGARFSQAERMIANFTRKRCMPLCESNAGRSTLAADHPCNIGAVGVTGSASANELVPQADVVLAIGTRLGDFTTSSGVFFWQDGQQLISINTAAPDACKRNALALVGDAKVTLEEMDKLLGGYKTPSGWSSRAFVAKRKWEAYIRSVTTPNPQAKPTYGHIMGAIDRLARKGDKTVSAAGGLPAEHMKIWRSRQPGDFDCEYGYSCMGYEIAGAYGFKMGCAPDDRGEVISLVGDGSYLMMNSDILSTVMTGHKLIIVVCDNGGFAVINRLQVGKGGAEFNNLFRHCRGKEIQVDFVGHAKSMGAAGEWVSSVAEFEEAFARARKSPKTYLIAVKTQQYVWTGGDAWWDCGVPETSPRAAVRRARKEQVKGRANRKGGR